MRRVFERLLIKMLKLLHSNLLQHAHLQIGAGHNSGEEYVINTVLCQALKRSPLTIFDVGANNGDYGKMLRAKFSAAQIHCFEPGPETFDRLAANTKGLNIKLHNTAIGSSDGTITLVKSSKNENGTMLTAYKDAITTLFTFAGEPNESIECNMISIDSFCQNNDIEEIDFLKIDVEGHECSVLAGASKMINENKINIVQFEFSEFNIFSRTFFYDFYKLLPQYQFYRIMPFNKLYPLGNYSSSHEIFKCQNVLAINNSLHYNYMA
jgi:FkbM family methyltransferase